MAADRQVAAATAGTGMPASLRYARVHKHDVRHGEKRSRAGKNLGAPG